MAYYANIDSKNKIASIDLTLMRIDEYGSSNVQNIEVSENVYNNAQRYGTNYYTYQNGNVILNPNYEAEKQAEEDAEFNRQFFNTSLGYVRRSVSMQDGSKKDFLSDILPLLEVGVPILTYTRSLVQNKVQVTEQFLNECKQQMLIDFYGGE